MPLFKLDIEKSAGGEFWTNRYIMEGASVGEVAGTPAAAIVAAEASVYYQEVTITKYRVSDDIVGNDNYVIVPQNVSGGRGLATSGLLPLFVCQRVDFSVGTGRPSRKYLRGVLAESDIFFTDVQSGTITLVNTNYVTPLVSLAAYVDVDGQAIVGGTAITKVGMHQLRRGSRRRTQPVI